MPILKRAKKKLLHDRKRTKQRVPVRSLLKKQIKQSKKSPTKEHVKLLFSQLDKAVKRHIIHKNTASRLKSRITKKLKK